MNRLSTAKRVQILQLLTEGCSLRSTSRIVDCSINTVMKLLVDVGKACHIYQQETLVDLRCKRLEVDEMWSFVYAKSKNVPEEKRGTGIGSAWVWIATCADSRLIPCWHIGRRDQESANTFIQDLATRLLNKPQIISDGYPAYTEAIEQAFGARVNYGRMTKRYEKNRYVGADREVITGRIPEGQIQTSYVERQNLTVRQSIRRFARKTNAFSKKMENHEYAVALHYMNYNFCRIHKTLRVTPAMAAGVTKRLWKIEELLAFL